MAKNKDNNTKKSTKTGPSANNDQLGENAYHMYAGEYDNKGKNSGKKSK